jgi:hypothetical protein
MSYAIMRFKKRKAGGIASCDKHNERKKSEYKSNPDIDPTRSHENAHIIDCGGKTYKRAIDERIASVGAKARKDSVLLVETLITASPELMEGMDAGEQRRYFEYATEFIAERVGRDNIISAVIHNDERTPHMHLVFVPLTKDGRLSAKEVLGNRSKLCKWQDDFHAHMVKRYPDLERGKSAADTHRQHIPLWIFKQADNLDSQFGDITRALNDYGRSLDPEREREVTGKLIAWAGEAERFLHNLELNKAPLYKLAEQANGTQGEITRISEGSVEDMAINFHNAEVANSLRRKIRRQQQLIDKMPDEVIKQAQRQIKHERNR